MTKRKFKVLIGFWMYPDEPMVEKGSIIELGDNIHESWIAYWKGMGYIEEVESE